jgi:hypothetical protein
VDCSRVSPRPVEALRVQFVSQVAQRAGFAVYTGGDGGPAGGSEIRAVETELGHSSAEAGNLVGQGGGVGQGVVNLVPEGGQGGEGERESFDYVT